jgi:hypothetical protein
MKFSQSGSVLVKQANSSSQGDLRVPGDRTKRVDYIHYARLWCLITLLVKPKDTKPLVKYSTMGAMHQHHEMSFMYE